MIKSVVTLLALVASLNVVSAIPVVAKRSPSPAMITRGERKEYLPEPFRGYPKEDSEKDWYSYKPPAEYSDEREPEREPQPEPEPELEPEPEPMMDDEPEPDPMDDEPEPMEDEPEPPMPEDSEVPDEPEREPDPPKTPPFPQWYGTPDPDSPQPPRVDCEKGVTKGVHLILEAKPDRAEQVKQLLLGGLDIVRNEEPDTLDWYAIQFSETKFAVFDAFVSDDARRAHLEGRIPQLITENADLFENPPELSEVDILGSKVTSQCGCSSPPVRPPSREERPTTTRPEPIPTPTPMRPPMKSEEWEETTMTCAKGDKYCGVCEEDDPDCEATTIVNRKPYKTPSPTCMDGEYGCESSPKPTRYPYDKYPDREGKPVDLEKPTSTGSDTPAPKESGISPGPNMETGLSEFDKAIEVVGWENLVQKTRRWE